MHGKVLDYLQKKCIVSFHIRKDGMISVIEECDCYYEVAITVSELEALISELTALAAQAKGV